MLGSVPRLVRTGCAILATGLPAALGAQSLPSSPVGFWVGGSLGLAAPYEIGVRGTVAVRYQRVVVSARYAASAEFLGDWKEEIGGLVGLMLIEPGQPHQVIVSGGLGVVRGARSCILCGTAYDEATLGVLLDADFRLFLTGFFAIAMSFYGDINADQPFAGLTFGIVLGRP